MQKMHSKEMENQQKEKWEMTNEIASQVLQKKNLSTSLKSTV